MTLAEGIMALYRAHVFSGAIKLQDNGDGVFVSFWDEAVVGISQAEGTARALAYSDFTLVQVSPYRVEVTHPSIAGATVITELVQDGVVIGTGIAVVNGTTATETFIVPAGHYVVRMKIETPFIGGELEVNLWQS